MQSKAWSIIDPFIEFPDLLFILDGPSEVTGIYVAYSYRKLHAIEVSFELPSHPRTSLVRIFDKGSIGFLVRNTMVAELDPGNMHVLIVTVATMLISSWVPTGDTAKPVIFFCVLHDVLLCPSVTLGCLTSFSLCKMWASFQSACL